MKEISFSPIGIIHSPFSKPKGTPIQPSAAGNVMGTLEVFPEFTEGLKDIEGFSHIILIYYFHLAKEQSLLVTPFMDKEKHGVFATRASGRPNPIGFSVVSLENVKGNILHIKGIDIIDGTPLLDIKPCVPEFDFGEVTKIGWLQNSIHALPETRDDGRFTL